MPVALSRHKRYSCSRRLRKYRSPQELFLFLRCRETRQQVFNGMSVWPRDCCRQFRNHILHAIQTAELQEQAARQITFFPPYKAAHVPLRHGTSAHGRAIYRQGDGNTAGELRYTRQKQNKKQPETSESFHRLDQFMLQGIFFVADKHK
jgi:hypothetical protein